MLEGAWRAEPPFPAFPPDFLADAAPLLLRTGAGALAWWRIRNSQLRATPEAAALRQAFRLHALQAAQHERRIAEAVTALRAAGIEALLLKGWATARLYPEQGLRPYGDIDLLVAPEHCAAARVALGLEAASQYPFDLRSHDPDLGRGWQDLFARSVAVRIGGTEARIPGPEDHLRLLCMHFVRHAAWRPLWLCDVAAALEALPGDFDWRYCLDGSPHVAEWVACACLLARDLLGARLEHAPAPWHARRLPRWLAPAVFRQWGSETYYMHTTPVAHTLRNPRRLLEALRMRWPNPILATVTMGAPFDERPRWPYQLAEGVVRTARFAAQLAARARRRGRAQP